MTLIREHITPRHLARLDAVRELDTAPFNLDTDENLINAGLLEVLPNGDVQVAEQPAPTLCDCTDSGRNSPLIGCPACRGEGWIAPWGQR